MKELSFISDNDEKFSGIHQNSDVSRRKAIF